jgi:hypothetical protein
MNKYKEMMEHAIPSSALIQATKNKMMKEQPIMMKNTFRTVAAMVAIFLLTAGTVYAAWRLLSPSEVAEWFGNYALSAAFESENAVIINTSQTSGGFIFTLMGIASGSDLTDHSRSFQVSDENTYVVFAIQNADGSPMTHEGFSRRDYGDFRFRPLVRGFNPWDLFQTMASSLAIIDGIKYVIIDFDDVSVFADHAIYIHIAEFPYDVFEALIVNEETGEWTLNLAYEGINILFELPLDLSLADPIRAQQFLEIWLGE